MVHLCFLRNKKDSICFESEKLNFPPLDGGSLATLGKTAGKAGKKAAEMTRFFVSEWLREPGTQQMLVNKANPFLKKGIDQVSTAIRPKLNYKTNRKDLDGSGLLSNLAYGFNYAPWPQKGKGIDIHKAIGKLPKPRGGFTLPGHKYTGPYNSLDQQLRFDPNTGEILAFMVKPWKWFFHRYALRIQLPSQDIHKAIGKPSKPKGVSLFRGINILVRIIHWINSCDMILKLEKSWSFM